MKRLASSRPLGGGLLPSDHISKNCDRLQDLRARLSNRHLFCYLSQNGNLGSGGPEVAIARAKTASCHLEHFAKGYRPTKRLPLEQLAWQPDRSRFGAGSLVQVTDRLPLLWYAEQRDLARLPAPCEYLARLFSSAAPLHLRE